MAHIDLAGLAPLVLDDWGLGGDAVGPSEVVDNGFDAAGALSGDGPAAEPSVEAQNPALAAAPPPQRHGSFKRRSAPLLAFARQCKKSKEALKRNRELEEQLDRSTTALATVTSVLPGGAALLGQSKQRRIGHQKKRLTPAQFVILSRAAFLASGKAPALGVKHKRVICAAAKVVLSRQAGALAHLVVQSGKALAGHCAAEDNGRQVHISYLHMWDETKVRAQNKNTNLKARQTHTGMHSQTLMQRGVVKITCKAGQAWSDFVENWLCMPVQVPSTSAESLFGGLAKSMPEELSLNRPGKLTDMSECVSSYTFQPLCDRASGNLVILRWWAKLYAELPKEAQAKVLFWPDTCQVHSHARGKLALQGLRAHTMRHFSIAHLHRQGHVHNSMVAHLERLVARQLRRRKGPPPEGTVGLQLFSDILFDFDAAHHTRGKSGDGKSRRLVDLQELCGLLNGDLQGEMLHWCWDEKTRRPCCTSDEHSVERVTVALMNCLLGAADPVPAESRWTHILGNMRKTLLRRVCYRVGHACFDVEVGDGDGTEDIDGAAVGLGAEAANRVRARRTIEYYASEERMNELPVFTVLVGTYDECLLYPLLGDPVSQEVPAKTSKLELLLDRNKSLVGTCAERFWGLLNTWAVGGPSRKPWAILDMLAAPVAEDGYKRFARSQILRLGAAIFRRFEVKFSSWPFLLRGLFADEYTDMERREIAAAARAVCVDDLDPYTLGIRTLFDTEEKLLSPECQATLRSDFSGHGVSTDLIERLHSVLTHSVPQRSRARNFANMARENMLKQTASLHVARGGQPPLYPKPLPAGALVTEKMLTSPLLESLVFRDDEGDDKAAIMDATTPPAAASSSDVKPHPLPQQRPLAHELVPTCAEDGHNSAIVRKVSGFLLPQAAQPKAPQAKRKGLSPFLLERNKQVQAARRLKGGPLSVEDMQRARDQFKKFWDSLDDHTVYEQAYQDWLSTPPASIAPVQRRCLCNWAGGSSSLPVTPEEFCTYHSEAGWPTDDEVFDRSGAQSMSTADTSMVGADCSGIQLWAIGCRPNNVPTSRMRSAAQFKIINKGLANAIDNIGKDAADRGDVLLVVSGPSLARNSEHHHVAFFLAGVTYNPRIFDAAMCSWQEESEMTGAALTLPARCSLKSRKCRVTDRMLSIDMATSAELICSLMEELSGMELFQACYNMPDDDGSLLWSEITALKPLGCLWKPGLRSPVIQSELAAQRKRTRTEAAFANLLSSDPLASGPRGKARAKMSANRARSRGSTHREGARGLGGGEGLRDGMVQAFGPSGPSTGDAEAHPDAAAPLQLGDAPAPEQPQGSSVDDDDDEQAFDLADGLCEVWDEISGEEHEEEIQATRPGDDTAQLSIVGATSVADAEEVVVAGIVAAFGDASADVGVADVEGDAAEEDHDGSEVPAASAPPAQQPWELLLPPSQAGYISDGSKTVLRIQRDKPPGRCTISCYRHPGCNFLLNMGRTPPNEDLYRWLYEVEAATPDQSTAERKALAKRHSALAKERWSAPKKGAEK